MQEQPRPHFQPTKRGARQLQILTLFICMGAFVFSYNAVCLTQLADQIKLKNNLSDHQIIFQLSIATSAFNLGALISPLFYKRIVNTFGQLKSLFFIDLIGLIAITFQILQLNFEILVIARLTLGFIIGISTAIIPVYINSIAPPSMVGKLGTFNQLLQTLGVVVAYIAGSMINDDPADEFRWRVYLGFPALFLVLRILGLQLIYRFETLERHLLNGETNEIQRYCQMVYERDDQLIEDQVINVKTFKKLSQQNEHTYKRRLIVALIVIASNQFSGANSILFYAKQLFSKITETDVSNSQTILTIISIIQVMAVLYSTRIVDKIGRRVMILQGQAFIIFCLFGIFLFDKIIGPLLGKGISNFAIILLIFLYMIALNLTLGPCCIIYCSEIVEDLTWVIFTLKSLGLLIALTSQFMIQYLGIGYMFLLFFILSLSAHLFLQPRLKETQGLATNEIYMSFGQEQNKYMILGEDQNKSILIHSEQRNSNFMK